MKEKLLSYGLPALIILLFFGALFIQQLQEVKKQPQQDWSRSIPLGFTSDERPSYFSGNGELYLSSNGKVHQLSFDEKLNVSKEKTINTKITRGFPFWTDGERFIQLKDGKLISTENNNEKIISENVTGLSTHQNIVYYWNKSKLFLLDPVDLKSKEVYSFSKEILNAYIDESGSAIIQVFKDDSYAELYYLDEKQHMIEKPFAKVNTTTSHHIDGLTYSVRNNQLTLLYNEELRAQGTLFYKIFKLESPLEKLGTSILKPSLINFINEDTHEELSGPRSAQMITIDGKDSILFTSEGQRVKDHNAISLYLAPFEDQNTLQAKPLNTTKHFTYSPLQLSKENIIWLDYDGDIYELFGASQDQTVIKKSTQWTSRSVKEALYSGVLMVFSSVITVLISFYWVLPSLFLLILLYMFKPNIFEKEGINWVEFMSIIIFLFMPLTFMSKAMNGYFYFVAPEYFTFSGSSYIWLLVISGVTAMIWKYGRNPDWGTFGGVFYFMGVYILLYVSSIGPYIFNLF